MTGGVRSLLRAEGAATGRGWGFSALNVLAPDLSVAAYLAGPRVGATAYDVLHTYVGPLALVAHAAHAPGLVPAAYVRGGHTGFDRALGYGLGSAAGALRAVSGPRQPRGSRGAERRRVAGR